MKRDQAFGIDGGAPAGVSISGGRISQSEFDFAVWIANRQPLAREMSVFVLAISALPMLREAKRTRKIGRAADFLTIIKWVENDQLYHRSLSHVTELQAEFIIAIVSTAIAFWDIQEQN
jgi:hypothetical protein